MATAVNQTKIGSLPQAYQHEQRIAKESGFAVELSFAALSVLGTFVGIARPLQLLFTPLAAVVGFYLLRTSRARYIRFTVMLFFFTPLIRRMADYHAGWQDPSAVLIAPLLVAGLAIFYLPGISLFLTRQFIPFFLVLLSLVYSWIIGIIQVGFKPATTDFSRWVPTIIFALYCVRKDDELEDIATTLKRCLVFGLIVMGLYALIQSYSIPAWDLYWLQNVNADSFGSVYNETARVWGTMNSPGPFGATVAAGILFLMGSKQKFTILAQLVGAMAMILSEVRSAWLGLAAGLVVILFYASKPARLRVALFAGLGAAAVAVLLLYSTSGEGLSKRFETLGSVKQDESLNERLAGTERALPRALQNPFGSGMGYLDTDFEKNLDAGGTGFGAHDNGFYEFLVTLGLFGTVIYFGSMAAIIFSMKLKQPGTDRDWTAACLAVCVCFFIQMPTGNTMAGVDGVFFWLAATFLIRQPKVMEAGEKASLRPAT